MRIIFSRKGFDSAAGGGASPIINGRPVTLPIPSGGWSSSSYADLGLGEAVERASKGKVRADDPCHHDPMFLPHGTCLFGQCGAAQTHLANRGVRAGDVFLFFGLFRDGDGAQGRGEPHHRIFGYLKIEEMIALASCEQARRDELISLGHPHALGMHGSNDVIYRGEGRTAASAGDALRLTVPGGPLTLWQRPAWLRPGGLSYHDRTDRWLPGGRLKSVARGQEFVAPIGRREEPRRWLANVIEEICGKSGESRGES